MNQEQIKQWAIEAGMNTENWNAGAASLVFASFVDGVPRSMIERFAAIAAAWGAQQERERCALVCDNLRAPWGYSSESTHWIRGTDDCAAAIRARVEKP